VEPLFSLKAALEKTCYSVYLLGKCTGVLEPLAEQFLSSTISVSGVQEFIDNLLHTLQFRRNDYSIRPNVNYSRGSQPGVHVLQRVHLPIRRGTFKVSSRREIYIYISFISKNLYISVNINLKSRYVLIFQYICD